MVVGIKDPLTNPGGPVCQEDLLIVDPSRPENENPTTLNKDPNYWKIKIKDNENWDESVIRYTG